MLYLYLAKRDKKDVKLVTLLKGNCPKPIKLVDLSALDLPAAWTKALSEIIARDRMHFDLWMESALDVFELQRRLKNRGFKQIPIMINPIVWLSSIPTGVEVEENNRLIQGNCAPEISSLALKKMQLAHERLRRTTP